MASATVVKTELKRVFQLFISYAREDAKIAIAVSNALQTALGPSAEVFIDSGLPYGLNFEDEIRKRLDETDALVVIDSETLKPPFGWTGTELGRFMHAMENDPANRDFKRRIIPVYGEKPSDVLARHEGIKVGISRGTLSATPQEYEAGLQDLAWNHPSVVFLRALQIDVDHLLKAANGVEIPHSPDQRDLPEVVRQMQLAIFNYLKTTPESTLKPQKQITIRTSEAALNANDGELPDDALLIPVGSGMPMSIFGIDNSVEMDWGEFKRQTQRSDFRNSWVDAITGVVTSSKELEVDNSQVIISNDETHTYRVILTTGTKYYDGVREYNLYFVEYLRRRDLGDRETTLLLKGLNLFCCFRFMFLEENSEFSSLNCAIARKLTDFAREMERELNLVNRDAQELGVSKASVLVPYVEKSRILAMIAAWRPLEIRIRGLLSQIRNAGADAEQFRAPLVAALSELETSLHPLNAAAITEMAEKLKRHIAAA
jgi:hypothetical protein